MFMYNIMSSPECLLGILGVIMYMAIDIMQKIEQINQ